MKFIVRDSMPKLSASAETTVVLVKDNWNDWYEYKTMYSMTVIYRGRELPIGTLKIGQKGMAPTATSISPDIPNEFEELGPQFFSIGQSEGYYESINDISVEVARDVLSRINDVAFNLDLFKENEEEHVMNRSLLRYISKRDVSGKYARVARDRAVLTPYRFSYQLPVLGGGDPPSLDFQVVPHAYPPMNIHILIGRNGVGKTTCLNSMVRALIKGDDVGMQGHFRMLDGGDSLDDIDIDGEGAFSQLVSVSFSPFDSIELPSNSEISLSTVKFSSIGLQRSTSSDNGTAETGTKTPSDLMREFVRSVGACRHGRLSARWLDSLRILESDPLFREADVTSLYSKEEEEWESSATKIFSRLSSGHRVVLLATTRLVELVRRYPDFE